MVKKIMNYLIISVLVILFLVFYARWFERSSVYFPYRAIESTPALIGLPYEDIYFETSDGVKINAWFIPAPGVPRGTILFCHGNAGNISHRLEIIKMLNDLDLNVFIFDYRGYGKSGGSPSEKGTYLDALAAYEYLESRDDVDKERIIVHGKSLGASVTIDLATKVTPRAVISESAFTSIADIGQEIYPFLPMKLINTIKYDNLSKIETLKMPKLIIHSRDDEIIPFHHGKKLFDKAAEPKEFYQMKGSHNEGILIYRDEYLQRIDEFLREKGGI
ncbi:MAG: alpha/beta hydrolase [Candidatus Omnitrophota bacterium]